MPTCPDQLRVCIRPMIVRDLQQVSAFLGWSAREIRKTLEHDTIGVVAEHHDAIAGVLFFEPHPRHLVLIALATHPLYRRRGVARQLLAYLHSHLRSRGTRTHVLAEVDEYEVAAQLTLKAAGYKLAEVYGCILGGSDRYEMRLDRE